MLMLGSSKWSDDEVLRLTCLLIYLHDKTFPLLSLSRRLCAARRRLRRSASDSANLKKPLGAVVCILGIHHGHVHRADFAGNMPQGVP